MLNFKDWKLASADGNVATLRHAKGHEMRIHVKSLPKIQREQIMRLAKANEYKDGGEVQKFSDDENEVQASPQDSPARVPANDSSDSAKPAAAAGAPAATGGSTTNIYLPQAAPAPQQPANPQPPQNPISAYAAQPIAVKPPQVSPGVPNIDAHTGQPNATALLQNDQEAQQDRGRIAAAQAEASIPVEKGYNEVRSKIAQSDQDLTHEMGGHVEEFNRYIQQHNINPNAYIENMDAGKKTLSGLGLILGGMGAGMLGSTDNPALRFINQQIDRDIAGQQARINNKRTVLGAYRDLYGDSIAANNLAKASLLDIYNHKAQQIANQLGTPTALAMTKQLGVASAIEKMKLIGDAVSDFRLMPGTRPTSSGFGAKHIPSMIQTPESMGKQGPTTAQAGPGNEAAPVPNGKREWVDADEKPVNFNKAIAAGINPESTEQELQERGMYPKDNPRSKQMKDITAHEIRPLLKPNAKFFVDQLRYDKTKTPEAAHNINEEYKNAKFIDDNMKKMNALYGQAIEATEKAGITGRIIDAGSGVAGALAGAVGSVFGHGEAAGTAGAGITGALDTREIRNRNSALNGLESIINASLNGVKGVDAGTVHRWVQAAKPVKGDTPSDIKGKFETLIDLVKGHASKAYIGHLLN